MISFPNISKQSKYRVDVDEAGLRARMANQEAVLPWGSVQKLTFGQFDTGGISVGYARLVAADGIEIAWTDHDLVLKANTSYWSESVFQIPTQDRHAIPLLSIKRGLLLASIVIERAGLVERPDGTFVRPDAVEAPVEDIGLPPHRTPADVLQKASPASKRTKQVFLLLAGLAAASWLWGVDFAVALLVYLMIHEYGHVFAMKRCGVAVSGIFVLPFMGAVAVAEEEPPTQWKAFLIAFMGPVFGAVITLGAAIALLATGGQIAMLRMVALSWAAISLFNLLPLGVLDGGRIVTSISFSTHHVVGTLASVAMALLCVLAALYLRLWILGLVALAAFAEMARARSQRRLACGLANMRCDPSKIFKALLACWERLGRLGAEASSIMRKKARSVRQQGVLLRPFFTGRIETPKMTVLQIIAAIGLYLGLLVFFVVVLGVIFFVGPTRHYVQGEAYVRNGQYGAAIAAYTKAIELNPQFAEAYCGRGHAYRQMREYDAAIKDYTKAVELKPDYAEAYNNMGYAHFDLKQYAEAIAAYKKTVAIKPDYADAHYGMGVAHDRLKQYTEAIAAYKKAIAIKPDYAAAYCDMGTAYYQMERYTEAIAAYKKARTVDPDYAYAYYCLGVTYEATQQFAEALSAYERYVALAPQGELADHARKRIPALRTFLGDR